jgi:thiamine pyrophosphate-dependent acetolactate synthase large subunit-like protein
MQDHDRPTVSILGDGDFLMGGHALWTAVHCRIPLLILINNNRSYMNDELHQDAVARNRNRPVANRWIGQRMSDPEIDLAAFARSQGATGIGPVTNRGDVDAALRRGVDVLKAGGVCLIDLHIDPPPTRTSTTVGMRMA